MTSPSDAPRSPEPTAGAPLRPATDPAGRRAIYARLFLVSFTLLFLEILLIRWVPAQVRAISYYKNVLLMASFLGMGIGCLIARRRLALDWLYPAGVAAVVGAAVWFAEARVAPEHSKETLIWVLYADLSPETRRIGVEMVSVVFFALTVLPFVALGKALGEALAALPALPGYALNVVASLLGMLLFVALSAASTPPIWWFGVLTVTSVAAWFHRPVHAVLTALVMGALIVPVSRLDSGSRWSPYYKIDRIANERGFTVAVNGSLHQVALPMHDSRSPRIAALFQRYAIWSDFKMTPPGRVLVLGAGTGNDVAVALARGAGEVHAVEIDPVILDLGVQEHPSRPYQDPRVRRTVQDARRFLRETSGTYDLIVFGTLDSQTVLSGMSSIRLDSYMYTKECFEQVRARLAPEGILVLYFSAGESWLIDKLHATIHAGLGRPPLKVMPEFGPGDLALFNVCFLAGDPVWRKAESKAEAQAQALPAGVEIPTDDWPNLYLARRTVPTMYATSLAWILLLSGVGVLAAMPRGGRRPQGFYFFMGAGFLLLETKAISELALLFGATWTVSAFVISAILVLVLAGTWAASRARPWAEMGAGPRALLLGALAVSLLAGWAVPPARLFEVAGLAGPALACMVALAPLFAAAWLYAAVYRSAPEPERAFGSNVLGALLGGVLEYASMVTGGRALALVALGLYGAAAWCARRPRA